MLVGCKCLKNRLFLIIVALEPLSISARTSSSPVGFRDLNAAATGIVRPALFSGSVDPPVWIDFIIVCFEPSISPFGSAVATTLVAIVISSLRARLRLASARADWNCLCLSLRFVNAGCNLIKSIWLVECLPLNLVLFILKG